MCIEKDGQFFLELIEPFNTTVLEHKSKKSITW